MCLSSTCLMSKSLSESIAWYEFDYFIIRSTYKMFDNNILLSDMVDTYFHESIHHYCFMTNLFCLERFISNYAVATDFLILLNNQLQIPKKLKDMEPEVQKHINFRNAHMNLFNMSKVIEREIKIDDIILNGNDVIIVFSNKNQYKLGVKCILEFISSEIDLHFANILGKSPGNFDFIPYRLIAAITQFYTKDRIARSDIILAVYSLNFENPNRSFVDLLQWSLDNNYYTTPDILEIKLHSKVISSSYYQHFKNDVIADIETTANWWSKYDAEVHAIMSHFVKLIENSLLLFDQGKTVISFFRDDILSVADSITKSFAPVVVLEETDKTAYIVHSNRPADNEMTSKAFVFLTALFGLLDKRVKKDMPCPCKDICIVQGKSLKCERNIQNAVKQDIRCAMRKVMNMTHLN